MITLVNDILFSFTHYGHTPTHFELLYSQEVSMPIELELTSFILALQDKELNSTNITQRFNAILSLVEKRNHSLINLKKG